MKRKLTAIFLIICLVLTMTGNFAFAYAESSSSSNASGNSVFSDLKPSHWAYGFIEKLKEKGALKGYDDGTIKPDARITRAEFTKTIVLALNIPLSSNTKSSFKDVSTSHWAFKYIETAKEAGVVDGYKGGSFRPGQEIKRSEVAKMAVIALKLKINNVGTSFSDIGSANKSKHWAYDFIMTARNAGLLSGYDATRFAPDRYATRAEVFKVIYKTSLVKESDPESDIPETVTNPADEGGGPGGGGGGPGGGGDQPDQAAPTFSSATVNTVSLVLTYSEDLDTNSKPDTSDFTVKVNDAAQGAPSNISIAGSTVTITLSSAVKAGDTVTISYTPGSKPIKDLAGNSAAAFNDQSVANNTASIEAPKINLSVATSVSDSTKFLYTGSDPVQTGVADGTIKQERAAVIRGKVITRDGTPIAGVNITILNHSEFGSTNTKSDGCFDMAVNGGGVLTINYEKDGYLPVQRQETIPWQDYTVLDDVVMVQVDTRANPVTLNSSDDFQVAQGTIVMDEDGTREATLLIPKQTTATITLPDGTQEALTGSITVRATEYTVGDSGPSAMPADLPPSSGYTYCVEYSVDEAQAKDAENVTFNKPIVQYVDNFLNFPVGEIVPVGYYDREKAAWIPSDNGKVIKILAVEDGLAELDINGSGLPADEITLAALGVTDEERQEIATLYENKIGQSFWRVEITHFTPWDCNWPYGPPDDAEKPDVEPDVKRRLDNPCAKSGSIIGVQNQTLGEAEKIVGTPYTLNYESDGASDCGGNYSIDVPLKSDDLPASLTAIALKIEVAGQSYSWSWPKNSAPDVYTFKWDGKDAYGRILQGKQVVKVDIGYTYLAQYYPAGNVEQSFAKFGADTGFTGTVSTRSEITIWQYWKGEVGGWNAKSQGLGGWTLNVNHVYDPNGKVLHLGTGEQFSAQGLNEVITTKTMYNTNMTLSNPQGLTVAADGSLYIADTMSYRVRKIDPNGIVTTVAGTGEEGYSGDGGPAALAELQYPREIAVAADGSLYIADSGNNCIRKIDSSGTITTVAGGGTDGLGDGGPATSAYLKFPNGVAVAPDGSIYIADSGNNRIRKVDTDGIITTVAGTGVASYSGDGDLATEATLKYPCRVTSAPDGSLYIADSDNNRVRKVDANGIITTVAGTGETPNGGGGLPPVFNPDDPGGPSDPGGQNNNPDYGDGGPATSAVLVSPMGVEVASDGSIYIADSINERVRKVDPSGIITTVAGGGSNRLGEGIPATLVRLSSICDVALTPDGGFYIADSNNAVVRKVDQNGTISTKAGYYVGGTDDLSALYNPGEIAMGPDGSLYIADTYHDRICKVDPSGIITIFAGASRGFSGDGGPATEAQLFNPYGVAVAPDGSIYIGDTLNNRIRKVDTSGIITTVAGTGEEGYSGDGGPATSAELSAPYGVAVSPDGSLYIADYGNNRIRKVDSGGIITTVAGGGSTRSDGRHLATKAYLKFPNGVAAAPDGSIYIADSGNNRIRKVDPSGIITTVAGSGEWPGWYQGGGYSGDGGPATEALLCNPYAVAAALDGSIYISDTDNNRIRKVDPSGIITTVAGNGGADYSGDNGPATRAALDFPHGIAVAPDGNLYVVDNGNRCIRWIYNVMPGGGNGEDILIPSQDGSELYIFDSSGRHLHTLDTLTGATIYEFGYDTSGRLISIKDVDGNITSIKRDFNGNATAVIGPHGHKTTLTLNSDGYLASIACPLGIEKQFTYTGGGLLTSLTDRKGYKHNFTYDDNGRLIKDENPAGGFTELSRIDRDSGYDVVVTSAMGKVETYTVESLPDGGIKRINTNASGAKTETLIDTDGSKKVTYPDGTVVTQEVGPDPSWGMMAPILKTQTVEVPGGTKSTTNFTRVTITDPNYPLSIKTQTDTLDVNGRKAVTQYDKDTSQITITSPEGRERIVELDAKGRVVKSQVADLDPVVYTYSEDGLLSKVEQGDPSSTHKYLTYAYDDKDRVIAVTDAAGNQINYTYNGANFITEATSPGGNTYKFNYDKNGNRTQVIMPNGEIHAFDYTSVNKDQGYESPEGGNHIRDYDLDGSLDEVTLPGARIVDSSYDIAGRVIGTNFDEADISYSYSDPTDRAASIIRKLSDDSSQTLNLSYDGGVITEVSSTGISQGKYTYEFDNNFFLTGLKLDNEAEVAVSRDNDGLVKQYGPFAVTRGTAGSMSKINDNNMEMSLSYNNLGQLEQRDHKLAGNNVYQLNLTYDDTGRIMQKEETITGTSHTYTYSYDKDGQLIGVGENGETVESYSYNTNGNRIEKRLSTDTDTETATYSVGDRLTALGTTAYEFNSDGFLSKRGSDTFTYSARGELIKATVSEKDIDYFYDGFGRRVARKNLSGTYEYLYGDLANPLRITAIRNPAGVVDQYFYDDAGHIFAIKRGANYYYIATDQAGTPKVVTDSSGAVVKTLEYDSFGNEISDSGPAFDLQIGFAGGLADKDTGLILFGLRDYDPASGRWMARDLILFNGGQGNLYAYAGNDPINYIDPSGLLCIGGSIYAIAGGGGSLCISGEGVSLCGEIGLGYGKSFEVSPFGGPERTGRNFIVDVGGNYGPASVGYKFSINDCGDMTSEGKGGIGPFSISAKRDHMVGETSYGDTTVGGDDLMKNFGDLFKGVGLQGKVAAQFCKKF